MVVNFPHSPIAIRPDHDAEQLRSTITDLDAWSQGGFAQIAAIARLTYAAFELPETLEHPDRVAHALANIASIADDMMNCITASAEAVGCNWQDPRQAARHNARRSQRSQPTAQ